MKPRRALIVDDSPLLARELALLLADCGFDATRRVDADTLHDGAPGDVDVVFIELVLDERNGFQLLRALAPRSPCPVLLVTGSGRISDYGWARQAGARAVLRRPLDRARVREGLRAAGLCTDANAGASA